MLIKVCGICGERAEEEIELLAAAEIDLVGLWHGVPTGEAELSLFELSRLAANARTHGLAPVLVTLARDPALVCSAVRMSGVRWVQLHGYQLPSVVAALKRATSATPLTVLKAVQLPFRERCDGERRPELGLVSAYERAGVDAFVLEASTPGTRFDEDVSGALSTAAEVIARLSRPFFLAGGITADNRAALGELARHDRFAGIDLSGGARDGRGKLSAERLAAIGAAWRPCAPVAGDRVLR